MRTTNKELVKDNKKNYVTYFHFRIKNFEKKIIKHNHQILWHMITLNLSCFMKKKCCFAFFNFYFAVCLNC